MNALELLCEDGASRRIDFSTSRRENAHDLLDGSIDRCASNDPSAEGTEPLAAFWQSVADTASQPNAAADSLALSACFASLAAATPMEVMNGGGHVRLRERAHLAKFGRPPSPWSERLKWIGAAYASFVLTI